ncbi:MAG: ferredoxin family protein [Rhodoferax sp.]|nr:ferredoxin family protein [Rhodoferax sp.]
MTFVVTESCIRCKYTDCVAVCPVDCFLEGPNFLVIDPNGCIDCGVCVPECPVEAIFADDDLPPKQRHFLALNAEIAASGKWPVISVQKAPLPEHERYKAVQDKLQFLDRNGA